MNYPLTHNHLTQSTARGLVYALTRRVRLFGTAAALLVAGGLLTGSPAVSAEQANAAPAAVAEAPAAVNINKADAATLASQLKGIGPSRAQEIVRHREAYGPFASMEELGEVKGIGPATLEQNTHLITLE